MNFPTSACVARFALGLGLCWALLGASAGGETLTVDVRAWNQVPIPGATCSIVRGAWDDTAREAISTDAGVCVFEDLFGNNDLTVRSDGFVSHHQQVAVRSVDALVRVELSSGDFADGPGVISAIKDIQGTIKPQPIQGDELVVRVVPLFGNSARIADAEPDATGSFRVSGLRSGNYLTVLVHIKGSAVRVVSTKTVNIGFNDSEVEVELSW